MDLTTNLGLQKPNRNETFDIDVQNSNMDIIDEFAVIAKADLEKLLARYNSEADWIVEQKISGVWAYRKWNSGFAECWLNEVIQESWTYAYGALMGGYYAQTGAPSWGKFPFTFAKNPVVESAMGRIGTGAGMVGYGVCSTTQITGLDIIGNQNSTSVTLQSLRVVGWWK